MVRERNCLMTGKATGAKIKALQTADRENDKCANCKAADPKYMCLEFLTFVCQECSSIHRGFGHRIAAIDHSEWTAEEYAEIEKGGNKLAAEEFLAFWNQTDFPRPGNKDKDRLRDFIRKAYVVKCWQRQPDPKRKPKPWDSLASKPPAAAVQAAADTSADAAAPPPPAQQLTAPVTAAAAEAPVQADPASAPAVAADAAATPATPSAAAPAQAEAAPTPAAEPPAGAAAGEPGAPAAPTAPLTAGGLVYLAKDSACFCPDHDSTEKRQKTEPSFKTCNGCKIVLQTNYSSFAYCPGCSAQRSLCMICGSGVEGKKYGPDGMPVESVRKCASRECSDGMQTDEATSVGNPDGRCEVDFSSSDAEGAELAGGPPPPAPAALPASAPAQANGCLGNLMDLDVLEAAAPGSGVPALAASLPFPGAVPVQQASPSDWLGEAIVSEPQPGAAVGEAVEDNIDLFSAAALAPATAAAATPEQGPAEVAAGEDWLGAAIPSCAAAASPAEASTGEPLPAAGGQCDDSQPALEPQAQATAVADPFAGLDCSPCAAKAVEAKPPARELLLETPKRATGDAFGFEKPQAMNFFCGSPAPAPMPGSSSVQDRFAALGELPLPGQQQPAGPLPSQLNFGGAGLMQMGSPTPSRGTAEAMRSPQAMVTPQRLDMASADDLSKMHMMVTNALQQRSQAGSVNASPTGSPCPYQMSPMMGGACNTPWSGVPEPPQLQFGDVLSALHEKHPMSEDKQAATPAKAFEAFDSALMSTVTEPEEPKEFGDLLAAFHKKNPIAGFDSLA